MVYKINVDGLSRDDFENYINQVKNQSFVKDEEILENYIVKEIYFPVVDSPSDVKVIYPVSFSNSSEMNNLINEITLEVKKNPNDRFRDEWDKTIRQLKLRKIENY